MTKLCLDATVNKGYGCVCVGAGCCAAVGVGCPVAGVCNVNDTVGAATISCTCGATSGCSPPTIVGTDGFVLARPVAGAFEAFTISPQTATTPVQSALDATNV